jgi:DNA-directed RNA polymerase specialized sigma24 family protein
MISEPAKLVRDVLHAKPGSVNDLMRQFGADLCDYATAIVPARGQAFETLLEDIFVDILAQIRAADTTGIDSLRQFIFESAARTLRARHRNLLSAAADPGKIKSTYRHGEVLRELKMSEAELAAAVSEGTIRAFREDDTTKFRAEDLRALMKNSSAAVTCIPAAQRELCCLHFRLGFAPDAIGRMTQQTAGEVEQRIDEACHALVTHGIVSEALA